MYNAADAFVLPSAFETQGLSMLEAMACGKTVIASNVGGVPDMITDNRDGFLIDFTDSERLNLCLESVLTDDEMRTIVGNAAVETARKYSIVLTTKKLLGIYDASLTSRGRTVSTQSTDLLHIILYCLSFLSSYALFHILQRLDII